jgi:hypothetical protein
MGGSGCEEIVMAHPPARPVSLPDHFSALRDPRQQWRVLYPLPEILLLVLCATLSGMDDFVEIRLLGPAAAGLPAPLPALRARHPGARHAQRPRP